MIQHDVDIFTITSPCVLREYVKVQKNSHNHILTKHTLISCIQQLGVSKLTPYVSLFLSDGVIHTLVLHHPELVVLLQKKMRSHVDVLPHF